MEMSLNLEKRDINIQIIGSSLLIRTASGVKLQFEPDAFEKLKSDIKSIEEMHKSKKQLP